MNYPFQFDDYPTIFEDDSVDSLKDLFSIKLSERPVRKISIIFDRYFFKDKVIFYRLENLILYIFTIFLTSLLSYRITESKLFSFLSIFLFSFHPVHVENILIITHRKELFLYIFSMLSFYFHIEGRRVFSVLFLILSILSKEVAIFLPFIFFVYDRIFEKNIDKKFYTIIFSVILFSFLFILLFGSIFGFYIPDFKNMDRFFKENRMLRDATYLDILKIQPYIFLKYIKNLFLPYPLVVDYYVPISEKNLAIFFLNLIILTVLLFFVFRLRKEKFILFPFLFFLINYLPISNFIPVLNLFADRYLFLPSFSFILFLYFLFLKLKDFGKYFLVIYSTFFLILTLIYIPNFKSEISLWSYVVKRNPKSVVGTNNLGLYYMKNGNIQEAEFNLLKSYQLDTLYTNSLINLGTLYAYKKEYLKSLYFLEKAEKVEPENVRVLYNLGLTYKNLGMGLKSRKMMERIVDISPKSSLAYNNLGASYFEEGYFGERILLFYLSSGFFGILPVHLDNLFGSYENARESFEKGVGVDKNYLKLKDNLKRVKEKLKGSF
ncbi:MAG: Putative tpr repeat protein [candidate division TA06 bacterium 32_111]|uniref:Putative tpr repeat protein n=1 Tax=candidate division TA06 bacterium 34_109 TaxID=1635277 RepID=A0A101I312_UNCT6|nr:MAG: Putative tpr repeat protein [candidate division TA06 bacterium 32_111]KUK87858.1 MAG: Putative tpr repeat protein [candidate division TA06 bacterium 34_109]